jgi:hypothetical protein
MLDGKKYTLGSPEDGVGLAAYVVPGDKECTRLLGFTNEQALLAWAAGAGIKKAIANAVSKRSAAITKFKKMTPTELANFKKGQLADQAEGEKAFAATLRRHDIKTDDNEGVLSLAKRGLLGSIRLWDRTWWRTPRKFFTGTGPTYTYYPDLTWYGWNDRAASVWNYSSIKAVLMCQHAYYLGVCIVIPPLVGFPSLGWFNNRASSMQV